MQYRALVPAAATTSVVLVAGVMYALGYRTEYYALAETWGAAPFRTPFLDIHGVTAAVQCHRAGFDVYVQNPCDVFGRVHAYSPIWLWFAVLPITTGWDNPLGLGTLLLFLAALPFLPPGRNWHATAAITLAAVSSATMFALERANIDVLMFALAMLATRLRTGGYAAAVLAGVLKFYPIVLLVLAVRERLLTCLAIWTIAGVTIAAWFALEASDILRGIANVPTTHPFDANVFGAHNLPFGLAALAGLSTAWAASLHAVMIAVMLIVSVVLARGMQTELLTTAEATSLMAGAGLLVLCFVTAQNVAYRAIFFLFVLPGLTALNGHWRGMVWVIVILMWNNGLRLAIGYDYWLARELAWWVVVTLLLSLLLRLIWESRAAREVHVRKRALQ